MGDCNIDNLKLDSALFFSANVTEPFVMSHVVKKPTRITTTRNTLMLNITIVKFHIKISAQYFLEMTVIIIYIFILGDAMSVGFLRHFRWSSEYELII